MIRMSPLPLAFTCWWSSRVPDHWPLKETVSPPTWGMVTLHPLVTILNTLSLTNWLISSPPPLKETVSPPTWGMVTLHLLMTILNTWSLTSWLITSPPPLPPQGWLSPLHWGWLPNICWQPSWVPDHWLIKEDCFPSHLRDGYLTPIGDHPQYLVTDQLTELFTSPPPPQGWLSPPPGIVT